MFAHFNRKTVLFAAAAVLLGAALGLVLCELGIRVYLSLALDAAIATRSEPAPSDPSRRLELSELVYRTNNLKQNFRLKPGACGIFQGIPIKLNSMGLRWREISREKALNSIRVVGLGDSTMFGWGIESGQRYADLLDRGLREAFVPQWQAEFIPAAAPAWNSVQEIEFLETEWQRLQPDLVVIQFDQNDIDFSFPRLRPKFLSAKKHYLLRLKQLWRGELLANEVKDPRLAPVDELFRTIHEGWEPLRRAYSRLAGLCRERNVPLIATFSIRHDLNDEPDSPAQDTRRYQQFASICKELKIDLIDPNEINRLIGSHDIWPGEANLHLSKDGHPGARGHALIAHAMYAEIVSRLALGRLDAGRVAAAEKHFASALAETLAPAEERGLYDPEDWSGIKVRWGQKRVQLRIEPAGETLALSYHIGHPNISPEKPVIVEAFLDGHPVGEFKHAQTGYNTQRLPLQGGEQILELRVSRAFRENGIWRSLAVALYPLVYEREVQAE